MTKEDLNRALATAESWTEKALLFRIGLPAPLTFVSEAILWALSAYGAWKLLA